MATTFVPYQSRNIGASLTKVGAHTVAAATVEVVTNLTVANVLGTDTTVNVTINDGANDTYLLKGAALAAGGTIVIGGKNRIALATGYSIFVSGGAANSIDAQMSVLQIT